MFIFSIFYDSHFNHEYQLSLFYSIFTNYIVIIIKLILNILIVILCLFRIINTFILKSCTEISVYAYVVPTILHIVNGKSYLYRYEACLWYRIQVNKINITQDKKRTGFIGT